MKLKSNLSTMSISLLALVFVIAFTAPATAQKADQQQQTSKAMAAVNVTDLTDGSGKRGEKTIKAPASKKPEVDKKPTTSLKNAGYGLTKGALGATYANDRAAINYFQKAIALDPNRGGAYFEQGISYGQLDDFDKAITLVNKALEMEPRNGLYLYGRGRIYLLAGKQDQAMQDFKKAAELDDEDAQTYLKHVAQHLN